MTASDLSNLLQLSILSDRPDIEDLLGFAPYAKTLAGIISDQETRTPLTIGIFGEWGRGKTSLMRMIRQRLEGEPDPPVRVHTVWFNAWLFSREPAIWQALISQVLARMGKFLSLDPDALPKLHQLEAWPRGGTPSSDEPLTLPAETPAGLEGATLPPLRDLESLRRQFEEVSRQVVEANGRLAVFVDDLDRCLPDLAVEVLEAIQLFLNVPGCVFVLGVAREVLEEGIRVHYRDYETKLDGARYLEKIIQIPFSLPPIAPEAVKEYVHQITRAGLPSPHCETVFAAGLEPNPRGIKRTINIFSLLWQLAQHRDDLPDHFNPVRLAKIVVIQQYHPQFFDLIAKAPHYLSELESYFQGQEAQRLRAEEAADRDRQVGAPEPGRPNVAAFRQLVRSAFTDKELRRFCMDRPDFRPVLDEIGAAAGLADVIDALIDLCRTRNRFDSLRDAIQEVREAQYEQYRDQLYERGAPVAGTLRDRTADAEIALSGPLIPFVDKGLLRDLLTCTADEEDANFCHLAPLGVREYIYLTRSTVAETAVAVPEEEEGAPFEPQMVTIPAGVFLMGTSEDELDGLAALGVDRAWLQNEIPQHEVHLETYAIGRYPVTNAEFAQFIEDGGYDRAGFWTTAGRKRKESEGWKQPRLWEDEEWNDPSRPVVGVSWYEAVAYCKWLEAKTGKPYRLPTEAEWEKAARGPATGPEPGRRWPWGNRWDPKLCNNRESGPGRTAPVGRHPDGDSPYGVGDMAGQIWEWCSTIYGGLAEAPEFGYPYGTGDDREKLEREDTRILRGGSWIDGAGACRCSYRFRYLPRYGDYNRGFRCARSLA